MDRKKILIVILIILGVMYISSLFKGREYNPEPLAFDTEIINDAEIIDNWSSFRGREISIVTKVDYVYASTSKNEVTNRINSVKRNGENLSIYFKHNYLIKENQYVILTGKVGTDYSNEIEDAELNYVGELAEEKYNETLDAYNQRLSEEQEAEEIKRQEEANEWNKSVSDEIAGMTKEEYQQLCKKTYYSQIEDYNLGEKVCIDVVSLDSSYVDASLVQPGGGFQHFYTCYQFSYSFLVESNTEVTDEVSIEPVYRVYGFLLNKSNVHGGSGHRDLTICPVYMDYLGDLADYQNGKLEEDYVEEEEESLLDLSKAEFKEKCTVIENGIQISGCDDELMCFRVTLAKKQKLTHDDAGQKLAKIDGSDFTYSQTVWKAYSEGSYRGRKMDSYLTLYFANEGNASPSNYYVGQSLYVYVVNYPGRKVVVYVE